MSDSSRPHGLQPTRLLDPRDFPGKSTGVGCHQPRTILGIRKTKTPSPAPTRNAVETLSPTGRQVCVEVTLVQADNRGLHEMLVGQEAAATDCLQVYGQRRVISEDPFKMGLERIYVKTGLGSKERGRKGKQERRNEWFCFPQTGLSCAAGSLPSRAVDVSDCTQDAIQASITDS